MSEKPIETISNPSLGEKKESKKQLSKEEEKQLAEIEKELAKVGEEKKKLAEEAGILEQETGNWAEIGSIEEIARRSDDLEEKKKKIGEKERELVRRRNKILGIEQWEELKFKVIRGYFEKETREEIKNKYISTISPFDSFVFAGRNLGYFTLYQFDKEEE